MSDDDFEHLDCLACGLNFGLEPLRVKRLRETHATFWCPNGHCLSFTKASTELEDLRAEVKELRTQLEAAQAEVKLQTEKNTELTNELEIWKPSDRAVAPG